MRRFKIFILTSLCTVMLAGSAFASVANEGNEAVQIEITKAAGGALKSMLYPGQSLSLPEDAVKVQVFPWFSARGDEEFSVKIVEPDGTETYLTKSGDSREIGSLQPQAALTQKAQVENQSNIALMIEIKKKGASPARVRLFPGDVVALSDDDLEVSIPREGRLWGDEKVMIEVKKKDGTTAYIQSFGGKTSLLQEETKVAIPSFPT